MGYEIKKKLCPPIENRYRFIYISKKETYEIFNGPKLFYPFDADDVFVEMINSKSNDSCKKLVQFNFICDKGMILAIHPNGIVMTLADTMASHCSGRRFTLEMLDIKDFKYENGFISRIWYRVLDSVKSKLIKYFIPPIEYHNPSYSIKCSICESEFPNQEFAKPYSGIVCRNCELRSLSISGETPVHYSSRDDGDNPIFIDGIECHRRYRFGGFVTMRKR